jgi:hypothetical protein
VSISEVFAVSLHFQLLTDIRHCPELYRDSFGVEAYPVFFMDMPVKPRVLLAPLDQG